jgi:hypothetical protein
LYRSSPSGKQALPLCHRLRHCRSSPNCSVAYKLHRSGWRAISGCWLAGEREGHRARDRPELVMGLYLLRFLLGLFMRHPRGLSADEIPGGLARKLLRVWAFYSETAATRSQPIGWCARRRHSVDMISLAILHPGGSAPLKECARSLVSAAIENRIAS